MENQHRVIKGYRDLSQAEIDLMNEIKAHEAATLGLVNKVHAHIQGQIIVGRNLAAGDTSEEERLDNAQPQRWASIARTDFQTGFMALVRAVAQPLTP